MPTVEISSIKKLGIIHKVMMLGQIIFAAIGIYLSYSGLMQPKLDQQTEKIVQVVALVLSATGFFGGTYLMKKKILEARDFTGTAQQKFGLYRTTALIQWAMLEGPVLFCIICFLLSGNYAVMALAGVLIICFAILAPTRAKIAFQLALSETEAEEL